MGQIFNQMLFFFEQDEWPFDQIENLPAVRTGFSGDNGQWMCYAHAREETEQFVFYSVLPVNIPANKRDAAAEFITRANYGMVIGNFEMNYEDGEIRYKTSLDVEGDELRFALIKQAVYANVATVDRYLPGLMTVIYADARPADAVAKIENSGD
ncbi:MAG: YbjN domain-containing protein [Anaerolineae bacterium]|nr:YbjN domain-containing protein [Anaerolineae bacterium]